MIWKLILITIVLMAIVFALMAIKILVQKGGKFPNTHIGGNKEMAKRGIHCVNTMDKLERQASKITK